MQKINLIVPIDEKELNLVKKRKELKVALKGYQAEFEVFFIANYKFKKPKYYRNLQGYSLVKTSLKTVNELIKKGFEDLKEGSVIVLDIQSDNYIRVLKKILENKTENNIVLYKPIHKKNKFKTYFKKLFVKFYYAYLKFWGLEKDLLCNNTNQYFNEDVVKVIKSLNKKNAYLRNFEVFTGYEVKIIKEEVEKTVKLEKLVSLKNNYCLIGVIAFSLGLLFAIITLVFTNLILAINNGITYYFSLLIVAAVTMFLSGYSIVKDIIKKRGDLV
jgi:hypothetical protein